MGFALRNARYDPVMHSARRAAPQIDRLVIAVNTAVGGGDENLARDAGLSGPGLTPFFADFLLSVGIERSTAKLRIPYAADGMVETWFDEATSVGALEVRDGRHFASERLVPLATAVRNAGAKVAVGFWDGHDKEVEIITAGLQMIISAAPDEFTLAAAHREVPEPGDRYLRLHQRLTTMRYFRAHAHISAWQEAGLTPFEIVAMTGLWRGGENGGVPGSLVQRGYAEENGLTEEGEMVRDEIEIVTNLRVEPLFEVLGEPGPFLDALDALPSEPDEL